MSADAPKFKSGNIVYHLAGGERGVVNGVLFTDEGTSYRVSWEGRITEFHSASELTKDRARVAELIEDDDD